MMGALRGSILLRCCAVALLLALSGCSQWTHRAKTTVSQDPRKQLAIGYTLLYQEADGIPKLEWLLMFKKKPEEMGRLTNELASFYQQLAKSLEQLSRHNPAVRIDVEPMSPIEAETRKAIGADLAKDMAPVVGRRGVEFEREVLLMFYNSLNEQRHLVGVMLESETDPSLKEFLRKTKGQLDERYARVEALLRERYFKH